MRRTPLSHAVLVALAVVALGACAGGDSDDPDEVQADLADQLEESLGLDAGQSDCFSEILVDEIGTEDLGDIDFSAEEPPEGMEEQLTSAALTAIERCDIDVSAMGG